MQADIGLIGLAVMGENLVMNMESKGFTVAVYNRTTEKVRKFTAGRAAGKNILGAYSPEEFVSLLKRPRKVMFMVKAGDAVDALIETLLPLLEPGDILIDGGNSYYKDTERRTIYVESKGLFYIGTGVSGGEEGALKGPSIMPGGSKGNGMRFGEFSKKSVLLLRMVRAKRCPVVIGSVQAVRGILLKWCIMASNTAICS